MMLCVSECSLNKHEATIHKEKYPKFTYNPELIITIQNKNLDVIIDKLMKILAVF